MHLVPINDQIRRTTLCNFISMIERMLDWSFALALIYPSSDSTKPDPDCFRMAREHILKLIEQKFGHTISTFERKSFIFSSAYPGHLQSIHHVNYQLKILTSNQLQLHGILSHTSSLAYFMEVSKCTFYSWDRTML